jgi:2,3-bisphosphoglycerate-dependent phosphoglycerate mutase
MTQQIGKLVIVRHHESEWNKLGKWTGITEVHLTEKGFKKSQEMGELVKDVHFNYSFTSNQIRCKETLTSMLNVLNVDDEMPVQHAKELNERDYGDYTGKNKWEMANILGQEEFNNVRRGWDCPVPNGETLKMVYERAVPYFLKNILPLLKENKNVLIVSHGNTIRALTKYIENISDKDIADVEMIFGSVVIYDLNEDGHVLNKEVRKIEDDVDLV